MTDAPSPITGEQFTSLPPEEQLAMARQLEADATRALIAAREHVTRCRGLVKVVENEIAQRKKGVIRPQPVAVPTYRRNDNAGSKAEWAAVRAARRAAVGTPPRGKGGSGGEPGEGPG